MRRAASEPTHQRAVRTLGMTFDFIPFKRITPIVISGGESIVLMKAFVVHCEAIAHQLVLVLLFRLFGCQLTAICDIVRDWKPKYFQMRSNLVCTSGFWNTSH